MRLDKLVFLDESGVNIDETRRYGRAWHKERVVDTTPLNTPKRTTILSSIRMDGTMCDSVFSGALNGNIFLSYVQDQLIPTLAEGDIVIMDNLRCHKVEGIQEAIEKVGAHVLYLPPYSPDLNPIEMLWSKIKSILRGLKPRCIDDLLLMISDAFNQVSLFDIAGWFSHCGY